MVKKHNKKKAFHGMFHEFICYLIKILSFAVLIKLSSSSFYVLLKYKNIFMFLKNKNIFYFNYLCRHSFIPPFKIVVILILFTKN